VSEPKQRSASSSPGKTSLTTTSIFDYLPLGIVISDTAGAILQANQTAHRLLHLTSELSTRGQFLGADGRGLDPARHPSARALHDNCALTDEHLGLLCDNGDTIWLRVTATPVPDLGVITTYCDETEGRRTEADLRHHIDQLDAFFDTNLDLLALLNSQGQAIRLNPAWATLLGYETDQLVGARILDFVHPSDMETTLGALARLRTRKEVVGFVSRIRHKKGSYRFLEWRATCGADLIYATARDITDQRLAEAALRESEARFRAIFEQAAVGVAEVDAESGRYIQVNQRFCDILGYTPSELLALGLESLAHPQDLPGAMASLRATSALSNADAATEKRCLHKDGHTVWINVQIKPLGEWGSSAQHLVVVIEDVSLRVETDELLRKSLADVIETNQRLNFQITRMPLGYIAWDLDDRVQVWNASAMRIFGWAENEVLHRDIFALIVPSDLQPEARKAWSGVLGAGDVDARLVLENCTRDGKRITCEWFGAPNVDATGHVVGSLWMVHDISERLRIEERILRSQRMESLCSFAGGIAHDMSHVLHTIASAAASQQGLSATRSAVGSTDQILQACERARNLVRGLLDFSRCDLLDAQAVDLNAILDEQIQLLGHSIGPSIRVERDYDPSLATVSGDAFALGGAFMHLILNALGAMPAGGTLSLRTRTHRREGEVTVEIEDTGCGMSKEVLDRAMEPFFTTHPQGKDLGLGLPAVYGAIKAHRGSIEIRSEPDRGTVAQITVPIVREKPVTGTSPAVADGPKGGLRILLVDDDDLVQTAISAQLRRLGHRVLIAKHGQEALDKLQEGATVDLVLLDIDMPVLSGGETLPRLRALRPTLPVIIETGNLDQAFEQLGERFSDVTVLARPFRLAELRAALAPWTEGAPQRVLE
jgi:two-component system cell cycle sensor histidine kinase/response regulator CckA